MADRASGNGTCSICHGPINSTTLGITTDADKCDAVLRINGDEPGLLVIPERNTQADPAWRTPAPAKFYVDFETVSQPSR